MEDIALAAVLGGCLFFGPLCRFKTCSGYFSIQVWMYAKVCCRVRCS